MSRFLLAGLLGACVWSADLPVPLRISGLAGGVCELPRAGDGRVALAIAQTPGWLVHAQVTPERLDAARAAAAQAGLLATRVWFDAGSALAERLADLVVIEDLAAADLTDANRTAWLALLAPRRGVLAVSGSAEAAAVARWLPGGRPVPAGGRTWFVATRPADAGMEEWTHRLHNPANTQVSQDATVHPQYLLQWLGLPLHEGFWGSIAVSAQGRLAVIGASRTASQPLSLSVRSLHNGQPLWERSFTWDTPRDRYAGGIYSGRSCLVTYGDELLLARAADIERLDAETGAERGRIAGPLPDGQIKWLVAVGTSAYVLAGAADGFVTSTLQQRPSNPVGTVLAAYDLATGRQRWKVDLEGPADERSIALAEGRVVYHADGSGAVARAVADGAVQWRRAVPELEVRNPKVSDLLSSERLLLLAPEAALFGGRHRPTLVALSPTDGQVLWKRELQGRARAVNGVAVGGIWYSDAAYDLKTGAKTADQRIPGSGCGPSCVVNTRFVTAFGAVQRIGEKNQERSFDAKGPCDIGTLVADGTLTSVAGACHCALELMGSRAIAAGSARDPHGEPTGGRLVAGTTTPVPPLAVDARDWAVWRHDGRRSGSTVATLPAQAALAWTAAPLAALPAWTGRPAAAPEHAPAAPVTAAGLVWYADATGLVRCLAATDGTVRWQRQLGTAPAASPTLAEGRLFVPLSDGWLVALGAQDGVERWRWRVAPHHRLITAWGRLQSTWPVLGGATVHGGMLYTAAGFQGDNGISLVALDPATGAVRWERRDLGASGVGLLGQLLVANDRLWIPSGSPIPVGVSLADGSGTVPDQALTMRNTRRGILLADLGEGVLLTGGRRVEPKHGDWSVAERTDGFNLYPFPFAKVPGVLAATIDATPVLPSWDAQSFVTGTCCGKTPTLQIRALADLRAGIPRTLAKPNHESFSKVQVYPVEGDAPASIAMMPVAVALAADGIAVAHAKRDRKGSTTWHLAVLARDGKPRWEVDLPAQPRFDGVVVDRDGRILLPLMDGRLLAYAAR